MSILATAEAISWLKRAACKCCRYTEDFSPAFCIVFKDITKTSSLSLTASKAESRMSRYALGGAVAPKCLTISDAGYNKLSNIFLERCKSESEGSV